MRKAASSMHGILTGQQAVFSDAHTATRRKPEPFCKNQRAILQNRLLVCIFRVHIPFVFASRQGLRGTRPEEPSTCRAAG